MRLAFLGAASTVTGSQFLLSTDRSRVLVDCGMFQGSPSDVARNRLDFAFDPRELDSLLLTHAHLDHCGLIPLLVREGFRGTIVCTRATVELARLVLLDSGKVQAEQAKDRRRRAERKARKEQQDGDDRRGRGRPGAPDDELESGLDPETRLRLQPPHVETSILEPLYDVEDAEASLELFRGVDYDEPVEVAAGVRAVFRDAGHILGSAIVQVDASDSDGRERRLVFSGDLGRPNTPIIRDPTAILDGADYVLVESTYGGREHEPGEEATRLLGEAVQAIAGHQGVLLIPAFSIGRTQELVWQLDRLLDAGAIPHVPLYLDSPMAARASDIYRRYSGYYDEETYRLLQQGETPLDYPGQRITRTADESKAIERAPRPMMIVSANGMLTGGRVVHHLRDLVADPAAMILFVGYQGQGTLGSHLQAGADRVRIDGAWHEVRCDVRSISGFSAHADESEILDWLRHFAASPRRPRRVFLVHGDPDAAVALEGKVRRLGLEPHRPSWREEIELS